VPKDEIDKRYINHPYYIAPDGKTGIDAFAVIYQFNPLARGHFLDARFLAVFLVFEVFLGTFLPSALASESPMAIACLRLLTFLPDRPLLRVPALRFFIARPTLADAFLEYFRAMIVLPVAAKQSTQLGKVPSRRARAPESELRSNPRAMVCLSMIFSEDSFPLFQIML
jgi:hypothetical protein